MANNNIEFARKFISDVDILRLDISNRRLELERNQQTLENLSQEQTLASRSSDYMTVAKHHIQQTTLRACEKLLTSAVQTVFETESVVMYSEEHERFVLDKGDDLIVDISSAEGGGLISLISFVLNVYLIIKRGSRRLLIYDEQFTQVSAEFFDKFVGFMRYIAHELNFDILLVTHDVRLEDALADHVYFVKDGEARQIK